MHIGFLNPQGNFDPEDSYWTEHPDFGGQLVYVKSVALAMSEMGHQVDILTRQISASEWPEFAEPFDAYPGVPNVRIVRLPAGPNVFLRKELLWPHLVRDWVPAILDFYDDDDALPDAFTAHYGDGGLCGVLLEDEAGIPFTFTGHSLGAQKMDKLHITPQNLEAMDDHFHFARRIMAERLAMNRSAVNVTSTRQERFEQYSHHAYRGAVDVQESRRFELIPPGVNLDIFGAQARSRREEATRERVRDRLARDIDEGRRGLPAIVASSRLDHKKNHVGLVRAFAHYASLQEQANLVLVTGALDDPLHNDGEASANEREVLRAIRQVVDECDLWGKISGFGLQGQPALAACYRFFAEQRSVFALTAHYEPFGLAPLEAAAAGLPVVVTRNGGPSESLREGGTDYGVLVDPADPGDIARGLKHLVGDEHVWEAFARRGRQRVLDRYTWERTAQNYLEVIDEIVTAPKARRPEVLLPIHTYFRDPTPRKDVTLEELAEIYFAPES